MLKALLDVGAISDEEDHDNSETQITSFSSPKKEHKLKSFIFKPDPKFIKLNLSARQPQAADDQLNQTMNDFELEDN